jgi:hypothetical protein
MLALIWDRIAVSCATAFASLRLIASVSSLSWWLHISALQIALYSFAFIVFISFRVLKCFAKIASVNGFNRSVVPFHGHIGGVYIIIPTSNHRAILTVVVDYTVAYIECGHNCSPFVC